MILSLNEGWAMSSDIIIDKRAIDFLRCAEIDLASSRCLYFCEHYSTSVYHLQQAVEKTLKSILFWLGKDVRVGHKTMTACVKILDIEKALPTILDPNIKKMIEDIIRIDECKPALEVCARRTYTEILSNIKLLIKIKNEIEKLIPTMDQQQFSDEEKKEMVAILRWGLTISILAYYLAPHQAFTRYPDDTITPLDYHPDKLGIVDIAPYFCNILHDVILSLFSEYGESPMILE
jgi:HEPN domain-containing protein